MERAKQKDIANEVTKAYSNNNSVKSSIIDK